LQRLTLSIGNSLPNDPYPFTTHPGAIKAKFSIHKVKVPSIETLIALTTNHLIALQKSNPDAVYGVD